MFTIASSSSTLPQQQNETPYCVTCGQKMVLGPANYFDRKSGLPVYRHYCSTQGCINNQVCLAYGGHDYGFLGLRDKCKRCGLFF